MRTYEIPEEIHRLFVRSGEYRRLVHGSSVCESPGRYFPYTERHLHALWFDDRLRPAKLKTVCGEPVTVEHPGRWNLEAGPDFRDAVLRIGRDRRRLAGDAEIHISPGDWKHHGHSSDSRYLNVRFHITWFSGGVDKSLFPPGTIHLSLAEVCDKDLDSIDVSAYPYAEPRARAPLQSIPFDSEQGRSFLESAGEERIRNKTIRLIRLIRQRGEMQALYEEASAALGYKQNKETFRRLAQQIPLELLKPYESDWKRIYAVMLGLSGLLPRQSALNWPEKSRRELRSLWDLWWSEQHKWEHAEPLARSEWQFSGVRPLNHPVRRLCVLAQWAASGFFEKLGGGDVQNWQTLLPERTCFWTEYAGWAGGAKGSGLIGKGRAQAMIINIMVPYRLAKGNVTALHDMPCEPMNSMIRETACALFGPDHTPAIYRSALARQGLIQIFSDFILTGRLSELREQAAHPHRRE